MYLYTRIGCYRRGIIVLVVAKKRTKSTKKQIKGIDVDKVGGKKPLSKSGFLSNKSPPHFSI